MVTDPKQYRPRALAMWQAIGAEGRRLNDPERVADAEYMATLLPLPGDWMISHGIDDPEGDYTETWRAGTPVHTAAWRRAEAMFRQNSAEVQSLFRQAAHASDPVYGYIRFYPVAVAAPAQRGFAAGPKARSAARSRG